ncbi:MAG: transporter substrate-binding domain-containing protein [Bacilli bacterium]|nr:transporter substrate-binding domain-containing protein [Bacilli bacterium]
MKKLFVLMMLVVLGLFLSACGGVKFNESKGELVIGLECEYSPFNWTETTKSETNVEIYGQSGLYAEGYDIQIARRVADSLGLKLVVKKIAWEGLIPALQSGDIDAIIAGMSPTEERKESINFSNPYYRSEHVVIVKDGGRFANATRFADFAGANVIGQKGTAYEDLASQLATRAGANAQAPLGTVPLIISSILADSTDVTVVEKPVALGVCASNPSLKWIKLEEAFEVDEADVVVSIGVRKVDTNLLDRINDALASISDADREALMLNAVNASAE